jgi:hypothetical protein
MNIAWDQAFAATTEALADHLRAGRGHLVTEDVVRFALAVALEQSCGVTPDRLAKNFGVAGIGQLDLVVDAAQTAVVELKFVREPKAENAAYTDAFGLLLNDFYRVARTGLEHAYVLHVLEPTFRRYLAARTELRWSWEVGDVLVTLPSRMRQIHLIEPTDESGSYTVMAYDEEGKLLGITEEPTRDDVLLAMADEQLWTDTDEPE